MANSITSNEIILGAGEATITKLFGTNGIRGVVNEEMNSNLALGIGQAWGTFLKKTLTRPKIVIGTDARLSNDMLKSAITAGFLSTGCDVVDCGIRKPRHNANVINRFVINLCDTFKAFRQFFQIPQGL